MNWRTANRRAWSWIVDRFGGLHMFGPLWIGVFDEALSIVWKQRERLRVAVNRP